MWADGRLVGLCWEHRLGLAGGVQAASALLSVRGLGLQVAVPHPGTGSEELCELDFMTDLFFLSFIIRKIQIISNTYLCQPKTNTRGCK